MVRLYYNMNYIENSISRIYTDTEAIEISNLLHDIADNIIENYYKYAHTCTQSYGISINHGYVNVFLTGFINNINLIEAINISTSNSNNQFYNKYQDGIKFEFFNLQPMKMENMINE